MGGVVVSVAQEDFLGESSTTTRGKLHFYRKKPWAEPFSHGLTHKMQFTFGMFQLFYNACVNPCP